ncbi:error-prone DNA polymerase [Tropicimonas sp. IMCC34011]|uniref:error-prone DNA polymerase n=1 Tax=Tropicimonas sp. IMCC34011 TaxID=2248759 RepID=UPI000E248F91|nr:error-prone DNA polymerase [Tropicimonas sp. IMCC34011]
MPDRQIIHPGSAPFAELSALSNFTFLTGASHPEEMVDRAAMKGLPAIAVADINSVSGVVRAYAAAREIRRLVQEREEMEARDGPIGPPAPPGAHRAPSLAIRNVPRLIPAARLVFEDGFSVTALPRDRPAWARLSRLISLGRRRATKGDCLLSLDDLLEWGEGMELLIFAEFSPPGGLPRSAQNPASPTRALWDSHAGRLVARFGTACHIVLAPRYDGQDRDRFDTLAGRAAALGIDTVASAEPLMHHGRRRPLADILCAIRLGRVIDRLGRAGLPNAERRVRSEAEMRRLFDGPHAAALANAGEVARRCTFCLSELSYQYPTEIADGESARDRLARLAHEGLAWRYPEGAPERVLRLMTHELTLIARLGYEPYFLTVADIVTFARSRGILCQGRGSAANSVVCYCLGVTSVSPEVGTMVFERFVSEARDEPPDIDVDFEHDRREEVIQYIYRRYGRERAGLCATVIHYRGKRAVREVGRAMGLSQDMVAALSSQIWGFGSGAGMEEARLRELGLDPRERRLAQTMALVREIQGFPRHLSQHVGGFVITEGRLDELCPVENASMEDRTIIPWDKDDIDTLGILKVDVLALGMLSVIRRAFDLLRQHKGIDHSLATMPKEDPATYEMLCRADSLGVFQVESRAQMNFLPRMRPRCFYDLVIEVAIIRPGPIQGDMVHPYLRRRNKEEEVTFPSDELGKVLGKTLGVPLFQEQAMQIAIIGAGFTPDEADRLRRALATFKKLGNISEFRGRFLRGMRANGYDPDFAERCFSQIEGFGSYGFPESHAASFALLVYASAWLKKHHPGMFACALLNSQPMGFYAPAQIVRDAREHGVTILPVCINASYWDSVMERDARGDLSLRLGFRQIRGLKEEEAKWISAARGNGYLGVEEVWRRAGIAPAMLEKLAEADAFAAVGLSRREALWAAKALAGPSPLPLFAGDMDGENILEDAPRLPRMTPGEEVVEDYVSLRLSLRTHPLAMLRRILTPEHSSKEALIPASGPSEDIGLGDHRVALTAPVERAKTKAASTSATMPAGTAPDRIGAAGDAAGTAGAAPTPPASSLPKHQAQGARETSASQAPSMGNVTTETARKDTHTREGGHALPAAFQTPTTTPHPHLPRSVSPPCSSRPHPHALQGAQTDAQPTIASCIRPGLISQLRPGTSAFVSPDARARSSFRVRSDEWAADPATGGLQCNSTRA